MNMGNHAEHNCHQGHGGGYFEVGWCAVFAARRVDPTVFVLLLLPPLIYESASKIDWFIFKRCLPSIVYLAFPGVVLAAFVIGLGYLWADPSWSVYQALTLGSILAATDPVSSCLSKDRTQ